MISRKSCMRTNPGGAACPAAGMMPQIGSGRNAPAPGLGRARGAAASERYLDTVFPEFAGRLERQRNERERAARGFLGLAGCVRTAKVGLDPARIEGVDADGARKLAREEQREAVERPLAQTITRDVYHLHALEIARTRAHVDDARLGAAAQ